MTTFIIYQIYHKVITFRMKVFTFTIYRTLQQLALQQALQSAP